MHDEGRKRAEDGATAESRVQELFLELIALPEGEERRAALDRACTGDDALRAAVLRLLDADRNSDGFLEPAEISPRELAESLSADTADGLIGTTIDGFIIESRIADGGMGVVYAARQEHPARRVAIKVVRQVVAVPDAGRRLVFESEVLALLRHPNVAQVYAAGTMKGPLGHVPYFAMELVEDARSITSFSRQRQLDLEHRLQLLLSACAGVEHGHRRGVIHRDLKPSNVLVDRDGIVKVIDFGIARIISDDSKHKTLATHTGALIGSLPYMAPEQCTGGAGAADARSDVYALGAILYELIGDAPVFDVSTKTLEEALRAVREHTPRSLRRSGPTVDLDLESIALKALSKVPEERYGSVAEFAADLGRYGRKEPVLASRPGAFRKLALAVRRNPVVTMLLTMLVLVLAGATSISLTSYVSERTARQIAEARRAEAESVTEFLTETITSIDPANARGSEPTIRELLDAAKETIGSKLRDQPVAEARMREVLGTTYYHVGNHAVAEEQLRASLSLTRGTLGIDSLEYASRAQTLAAIHWNRGQYDQAADLLRQALAARRIQLGRDHEQTLDVSSALATVLSDMGRNAEAEPLLREAITAYRERFPDGHPVRARSLSALGTIKLRQHRLEEAESMISGAAAMLEKHLGSDHPFTLVTKLNRVNVLQELEEHDAALQLLDAIFAATKKLYGEGHMRVAKCLEKQATSLEALGRMEESVEAANEAARIRKALSPRAERNQDRAAGAGENNGNPSEQETGK